MKETYSIAMALYEQSLQQGQPPDVCQCCGAKVSKGVQGCFELYTETQTRQYSHLHMDLGTFWAVDSHALQHPEIHGKKNNIAHLLRVCWALEGGGVTRSGSVPSWWQAYLNGNDYLRLDVPKFRGTLTVTDWVAAPLDQMGAVARQWAQSVWEACEEHHAIVRVELAKALSRYHSQGKNQ